MKNIKIPEEYFRFYLNKHHKDQNIYFLLKIRKLFMNL
jgi:hypothetical protein